jgi:N-acetylglutamate synthase-like GNAT family acetyltransferase
MIRALRPTDVLAYVSFSRDVARIGHDGASPYDGMNFRMLPTVARFLGRSLAIELGRETWVQVDRGHISGLAAAKRRVGTDVWDIDELSFVPARDAGRTVVRLLEQLLTAAADDGVHKVYLRLPDDSPAQDWVRQVGFFRYCDEVTYRKIEVPTVSRNAALVKLRQRRPADHQPLFQLYSAAVPFRVRQAEGMTLHEWRWSDAWGMRGSGVRTFVLDARTDYVADGASRPSVWVQVDRRRRRLTLLTDLQQNVDVDELLRFGLSRLGAGGAAQCAARDYQPGVASALERAGFVPVKSETLFARALAARVPELKLVPMRASLT